VRPIVALVTLALVASCAPPPERELNVGMLEYAFLPARIEVFAGERVRLIFKNVGRMEHDFATDERGRALGLEHVHLGVASSTAKDWTAPITPTSIKVLCSLPGHEQLGMTATLVIVPRGASSSPAPSVSPLATP
jgi:uncharacterized cupredoxin-like copper-binding protein